MGFPDVYLLLPGTAREALEFYRDAFGGELEVHSYGEFGRSDGPPDAVAHGVLRGPVTLFAADAGADENALAMDGMMLSLLNPDATLVQSWWTSLCDGGRILDPLQERPWGDHDGQVRDRYGVRWLVGHPGEA